MTLNKEQLKVAEQTMKEWLSHKSELGKPPVRIECAKEFDLHDMHYYIFRYKKQFFGEWLMGVCGGYEENALENCGHVFSEMKKYNENTAVEDATALVETIREYWMNRALKQEQFQDAFKQNTDFRTQDELPLEAIESQFEKSESRFFIEVGHIDCPTGNIVVADPLAYLPTTQFSPILKDRIPAGTYPVDVSICRQRDIGIRMCTARLKIKATKPVKYRRAASTDESSIKLKDGNLNGFPVDAGLICFCDAQTAEEYRRFTDKWNTDNQGLNMYDDYFAKFFTKSYQALPGYQRESGDFIEWTNPDTGNRLVMISSGFGDGFYNSFYGYDAEGKICEIVVPMVNPSLFGC